MITETHKENFDVLTSTEEEDYVTGDKCEITVGFAYSGIDAYSDCYIYLGEQTLRKMLELIEKAKSKKSTD